MTDPDQLSLKLIREAVAELSPEDQAKVKGAASQLRTIVQAFEQHGLLALALVGAETQVMAV